MTNRINALRQIIAQNHFDGFLVTDSDRHCTFYSLAHQDRRINWITQCQAQCGLALITLEHGAVFETPANYRLLAKSEMDHASWLIVDDLFVWIEKQTSNLGRIGCDPRLTPLFVRPRFCRLSTDLCRFEPVLSPVNWIDALSNHNTSLSSRKLTPIWSLNETHFARESSENKIRRLRHCHLHRDGEWFTFVTTAMDEIAWLLNLRANDMQCNPLFYSFMIISNDQLIVFTDNPHKVERESMIIPVCTIDPSFRVSRLIHVHTIHFCRSFHS